LTSPIRFSSECLTHGLCFLGDFSSSRSWLNETLRIPSVRLFASCAHDACCRTRPAYPTALSIKSLCCSRSSGGGCRLLGSRERRCRNSGRTLWWSWCAASWVGPDGREPSRRLVSGSTSIARARGPVRGSLARAGYRLKINNCIISKHFALCHDVEMICVAILVGSSYRRTPLLVPVIWTQICDHNNDALTGSTAGATATASGFARWGQFVALAAPCTAPASTGSVIKGLGSGCRRDAIADAELDWLCVSWIVHTQARCSFACLLAKNISLHSYRSHRPPLGHRSNAVALISVSANQISRATDCRAC